MNILNRFILEFSGFKLHIKSILYLLDTNEKMTIDELQKKEIIPESILNYDDEKYQNQVTIGLESKFEVVLSFPIIKNLNQVEREIYSDYKGRSFSSIAILNSIKLINDSGMGIYIVSQKLFADKYFFDCLDLIGFSVNTILKVPNDSVKDTAINLFFITIVKSDKRDEVFISEIDNNDEDLNVKMIDAMVNKKFALAKYGDFVNTARNYNYYSFNMNKQVNNLLQNYPYKRCILYDLCEDIKSVTPDDIIENSIYISRIGIRIFDRLDCEPEKYKNYFILKLNHELIFSKYLYYFLKSEIGKLILESYTMGARMPQINLRTLKSIELPLPSLEMQMKLVDEQNRLHNLSQEIEKYSKQITYKPESLSYVSDAVKELENILKTNDKTEKIYNLISKGETDYVEFKSAFRINELGNDDKNIQMKSIRAIASFLNTEGGILLIGVDDDGTISGLANEPYKNYDKLALAFKNKIRDEIGENVFFYVYYELVKVDDKTIIFVECKPSDRPIFITEKKTDYFYIKVNKSAETLRRQEMLEYINKRFDIGNYNN